MVARTNRPNQPPWYSREQRDDGLGKYEGTKRRGGPRTSYEKVPPCPYVGELGPVCGISLRIELDVTCIDTKNDARVSLFC